MAEYNNAKNSLTVKLVYYGPAQSGKTTNLMQLHDLLSPQLKGEMMTLETKNDRTLFFDLFPHGFRAASGLLIKFKLYTVPGQVQHDSTRKAVLSRADGVVFVADSQRNQSENNAEAFNNLEANVRRVGLDFESLPLVIQYNKRDLDNIVPEDDLHERWAEAPWPLICSSALNGQGVIETYEALLGALFLHLDERFELAQKHGLDKSSFIRKALGNVAEGVLA